MSNQYNVTYVLTNGFVLPSIVRQSRFDDIVEATRDFVKDLGCDMPMVAKSGNKYIGFNLKDCIDVVVTRKETDEE